MSEEEKNREILYFKVIQVVFFFLVGTCWAETPLKLSSSEIKNIKVYQLKNLLKKTHQSDMDRILREFTDCCRPNRLVGTDGHTKAENYLENKLRLIDSKNAGQVKIQTFKPDIKSAIELYQSDFDKYIKPSYSPTHSKYIKWDLFTKAMINLLNNKKNVTGKNIIWEKKGSERPGQILVLGAAYDNSVIDEKTMSIKEKAFGIGANGNASGVSILLRLVEYLSQIELKDTVQVVFFDFHELGLLGSKAYVSNLQKELAKNSLNKLIGLVNVIMVGQDTKALDKENKYGNMRLYIRKNNQKGYLDDLALAQTLNEKGKRVSFGVNFEIVANGFESSDQFSFWQAGLPAIAYSQNWESDFNQKTYHTESDLIESLNLKTLTYAFHFIAGGILSKLLDID